MCLKSSSRRASTETKDVETAPVKSESTPGFFQKLKGKLESKMKSKSSPVKEAPKESPSSEAPVEPVPEAEPVVESAPVVEETPAVDTPAAATTESKPATTESKISDKISEGRGFFNKVKKSFFTKSHSFSGSIPDSKLGVTPPSAPPAVIEEVPKEAETAEVSAPVAEVRRCIGVDLLMIRDPT